MATQDHDRKVSKDDELELKYFVKSAQDLREIYKHLKDTYELTEEPYHSNPVSFYYDVPERDDTENVTGHMLREKKLTLRARGTAGRGRPQLSIKTDGEPTPEGVIDRKEFERYISDKAFDLNNVSDTTFNVIAQTVINGEVDEDNELVQRFREVGEEITKEMNLDEPDEFTLAVVAVRDIIEENDLEQIFTTDAMRSAISIETEVNGKTAIFEVALDDCKFLHRDLEERPYVETVMGRTYEVEIEFKLDGSDPSLSKSEVSIAAGEVAKKMEKVAPSMTLNTQSKAQVGFDFLDTFDKRRAWANNQNDVLRLADNDNKPDAKPARKRRKSPGLS